MARDEEVRVVDFNVAAPAEECGVGGAEDGGVRIAELAQALLHFSELKSNGGSVEREREEIVGIGDCVNKRFRNPKLKCLWERDNGRITYSDQRDLKSKTTKYTTYI